MRQSRLFTKTQKQASPDMKLASHRLLYQAGFIRESTAGRYYFLPLGIRVRDKIVHIIESEMTAAGAVKLLTPVLHPLALWKETNRASSVGFELMTIKDRNGAEFALGGTAEEMMVDVVRKFTLSYRDLPFNIYQFSQKFRDELRARGGLLRVREFLMKDAYSFHASEADFKKEYTNMWQTYARIFQRLGLKTLVVEADNGYIGGDYCHEFVVEHPAGESRFLMTKTGEYAAHEDVAIFTHDNKNTNEPEQPYQEVAAKRGNTMTDGVTFHTLPLWQQIKDVMMADENNHLILAVIRGDLDVNEIKLAHIAGVHNLRPATVEEIHAIGSEPGFISPVGLAGKVKIIGDLSLRTVKNAYGGANKKYRDALNVNIDRDYTVDIEADIAMAEAGYVATNGETLDELRGIEVGNIFQLGYHYSKLMQATFTSQAGKNELYYMGCYGIGVDRTLATIVEMFHDDKGIIWPESVSPFQFHLLNLNKDSVQADAIYVALQKAGFEVLYDDRAVSAGVKLNDADLIGITKRLVIGAKTEGKIEYKLRSSATSELISLEEIIQRHV